MSTTEAEVAVRSRAELLADVARLQQEVEKLSAQLQPAPRDSGPRAGLGRRALTLMVARRLASRWLPEENLSREQMLARRVVPALVIWRVLNRR